MTRHLTLVLAVAACSAGLFARPPRGAKVLNYSFALASDGGRPALRIALIFKGDEDDLGTLEVPSAWGDAVNLEKGIKNLKKSARHGKVSVSYDLVRDWDKPPARADHHAIIEPDYFEFNTQNALVRPRLDSGAAVVVNFDWQTLPAGWALLTSFGADDRHQSFSGSANEFINGLYAGGNFRVLHRTIVGQPLTIALRGRWRLTDEEMATRVQKAIALQRAFWKDYDFPYYLVTVSTFDGWGGTSGGSGFTNAFALYLQPGTSLADSAQSLLAHEVFHTWNPYRMGTPAEGMSWFTEGFTRYYQDLLLFRAGLIKFPAFVERINDRLRKYAFSPARNVSNQEAEERHADPAVADIPSVRGAVAALWLDWKIRDTTQGKSSLDNVMLDLVRPADAEKPALSPGRVFQAIAKYVDPAAQQQFRGFIDLGTTVEIPAAALGPCADLRTDDIPPFELGIDREALIAGHIISGVTPDSEAFRAGLKDGQQVTGTSVHWDDASKPVKLTVQTDAGSKTIEYYPRGKPLAPMPQFHLATRASENTGQCIDGVWGTLSLP